MNSPIQLDYEGDGVFRAPGRWADRCDKQFVCHERYTMEVVEERSQATHNHQFAEVNECWLNLPERFKDEPWARSPMHLRRYALIRTGFCTTTTVACGTKAEALRWFPILVAADEYSLVSIEGTVLHWFKAKSQSRRAMGAKEFQASKTACLDFLAGLIGTTSGEIGRAA